MRGGQNNHKICSHSHGLVLTSCHCGTSASTYVRVMGTIQFQEGLISAIKSSFSWANNALMIVRHDERVGKLRRVDKASKA